MEKATRAARRIDALHERAVNFGLTQIKRVVTLEKSATEIRGKLNERSRSDGSLLTFGSAPLLSAWEGVTAKLRHRRRNAIKLLSSVWGLPREATEQRLTIGLSRGRLALPRVTAGEYDVVRRLQDRGIHPLRADDWTVTMDPFGEIFFFREKDLAAAYSRRDYAYGRSERKHALRPPLRPSRAKAKASR